MVGRVELYPNTAWLMVMDFEGGREVLWTWKRMCERTKVIWQR